mmetsp:Transcript_17095/g.47702  ORF Transcript_17095/g.47702 Transcript_17095/m.47702 type:complete len:356 (+) Transcript_17095:145-1212(+)
MQAAVKVGKPSARLGPYVRLGCSGRDRARATPRFLPSCCATPVEPSRGLGLTNSQTCAACTRGQHQWTKRRGLPSLPTPGFNLAATGWRQASKGGLRAVASTSADPLDEFFLTGSRLTTAAHLVWDQLLKPGDTVVDATIGNGHDTAFLAQCVGPTGVVYGFDIQEPAIASTTRRLESTMAAEERPRMHLVHGCHSQMLSHVPAGSAKLVCFNLGWLPTADRAITTMRDTTLAALQVAPACCSQASRGTASATPPPSPCPFLCFSKHGGTDFMCGRCCRPPFQASFETLKPGGVVTVMCYTGHEGGEEEYRAVIELMQGLSPKLWTTMEHRILNRAAAPVLQLAWRRSDVPVIES